MTNVLNFACVLLCLAAFQTPYMTGHISNLGHPCMFDQHPTGDAP